MSTSDKFRLFSEMTSEKDFIQALEKLVSGNAAVDSSLSGTYETGVNRPLGRLARNTDALLDVVQTTKHCVLVAANSDVVMRYTSGGDFFITGTTGIYLRLHSEVGTATFNTIASSASALLTGLSAGKVIYVQLDRTSNATRSLSVAANWATFVTTASNSNRLDYLVLGVVTPNNDIALFNGVTLRKDEQLENALGTDSQYGMRFVQQQNRNVFLTGGGTISVNTSANQFTFSSDLKIHVPGDGTSCVTTIAATTVSSFSNGSCVFASINRTGSSTATLTASSLSTVTIDKDTEDLFVVAYREGNITYLATGDSIQDGDEYLIDSSPVYALTTTDNYSGTSTTISGGVDVKTSAALIAESTSASSGNSTLRLRSRLDNRNIILKTTLNYSEVSAGTKRLDFGNNGFGNGILVSHPDYRRSASEAGQNRINPNVGYIDFTADRQVAYVVLEPLDPAGTVDFGTIVTSDHATSGHSVPSGTTGNIYVCDIEDVPEDDADVFVFAYRVDDSGYFTSTCILWDGTYLPEGVEKLSPGLPLDRAIISQQYQYSHRIITFDWVRSGQQDHNGNTTSDDRIAIHWDSAIQLYWPGGGVTTISALAVGSPVVLKADALIAYVSVPLEDRGPGATATATVSTTDSIDDIDSVNDLILFSVYGPYQIFPANVFPTAGRAVIYANNNPVTMFGGRLVYQRQESSGGGNAAITGNGLLGRTVEVRTSGDQDIQHALSSAFYPTDVNPYVTTQHGDTFKVGVYSGASHEHPPGVSSLSFAEKFRVSHTNGDVETRGEVQAVDFSFGDSSGASATKQVEVFYGAHELENRGITGASSYYFDETAGANATTTVSFRYLEYASDGTQVVAGTVGTAGVVFSASIPPSKSAGVELPAPPVGSEIINIKIFCGKETNFAAAADVRLRVSRNRRWEAQKLTPAATINRSSFLEVLTDGTGGATFDNATYVSPTSTFPVYLSSQPEIYRRAEFDFTDASVSNGGAPASGFSSPNTLWVRIGNNNASNALEVLAISIVYESSSVEGLLGAE